MLDVSGYMVACAAGSVRDVDTDDAICAFELTLGAGSVRDDVTGDTTCAFEIALDATGERPTFGTDLEVERAGGGGW